MKLVEEERSEYSAEEVLKKVYASLKVKGYSPKAQLVGYILSGDPTYITSYEDARSLITKVDSTDLLEEIVRSYFEHLQNDNF